jgi:murein DD-endopeptidase MepM/ murein hydrolase activator NlpD
MSAVVVGLLTQVAPPARADDPFAELAKQQDKLKYIKDQRDQAKNDFSRLTWQSAEAEVLLSQADQELQVATGQLSVIQGEFVVADTQLKQVEVELKGAEVRYTTKKAVLSTRIRAISEGGRVDYLGVLFGATTFSDFISRFDMLKLVVQQDTKLFTQVRQDKLALEQKQQQAAARKEQVALLKAQAEERKVDVEKKRTDRQVVSRTLDGRKRELKSLLDQWEQQEKQTQDQIASLQREMNRPAGRFSPTRPIKNSVITDRWGMRVNPITGQWAMHRGTDFAASTGTPVHAIEDGVILVAGWSDVYGNYIIIDHGGGISSLYGHNSKLLVGVGNKVTRDQVISQVGSTGWSTGPHCHLEIRINGVPQNPENYVK